jgi:ubiquinol-cytochrome c reductase cytochrome c subunit
MKDVFHPMKRPTPTGTDRSDRLKKLGFTRSGDTGPVARRLLASLRGPHRRQMDRSRRRLYRRLSGGLLLLIALTVAGGLAAVLTPKPQVAVADGSDSPVLRTGQQLFDTSCVSCHGANLQGVPDHGPSLIGVGEAAVYFQVSTGRMPAMRGEAQAARKEPIFDESQIEALGAYVQTNGGGGPTVARDPDNSIAMRSLRGPADQLGRGGDLFRLNCASCHNFTGKGGALSSGKFAPDLGPANEQQILTAMLTGPQNMPKFSENQLPLDAKKDIIGYVRTVAEERQPGGYGLGGFGPAPEGMAMWIIGMVAAIGLTLWIGARS